jgi:hypothetical protein
MLARKGVRAYLLFRDFDDPWLVLYPRALRKGTLGPEKWFIETHAEVMCEVLHEQVSYKMVVLGKTLLHELTQFKG